MSSNHLGNIVRYLRRLGGGEGTIALSDRQLLERFVATHEEEAFAELMRRHGAMVLAVSKRVLGDTHHAEDVFQAAFLILARKAASVQRKDALAAWLSRITYHLALKVRAAAVRRQAVELEAVTAKQEPPRMTELERKELGRILDEELYRLSEKLRAPLVLCYLEDRTYAEAARQLNWPLGTVKKRLSQARQLLRQRLTRRGVAQGAIAVLMAEWTRDVAAAALWPGLLKSGLRSAMAFGAGKGLVTDPVALAESMLRGMAVVKWKLALGLFLVLGGAIGAAGTFAISSRPSPSVPLLQDERLVHKIAADPRVFANDAKREQQWREELQQRHERWLAHAQKLGADPRLVFYYTFQDQQPQERALLNRALRSPALNRSSLSRKALFFPLLRSFENVVSFLALHSLVHKNNLDGAIVGCQWSEGRWPGKGALDFKKPNDRVRLHVPGEYQSLTFLAWVRVDAFDRQITALMLTDGYDKRAAHWQLHQGKLLLGIKDYGGGGHNFYSQPCLGPDQSGEWFQLATVYNHRSQAVTHYVNGRPVQVTHYVYENARPVKRENINFSVPVQIGNVEIGNWGRADPVMPPWAVVRNFNGRIDEFALFHEALSSEEIAKLYEIGTPYP